MPDPTFDTTWKLVAEFARWADGGEDPAGMVTAFAGERGLSEEEVATLTEIVRTLCEPAPPQGGRHLEVAPT